jgi:uronate dehydrogenase
VLKDTPLLDLKDPEHLYLGGPFASVELGNSGVASMNIVDDAKKV